MLHLEHDSLVGFVDQRAVLGYYAIESRPFKTTEPIFGKRAIGSRWCHVDRRLGGREHRFQALASDFKWLVTKIEVTFGKYIEKHQRSRCLLGKQVHAGSSRMQPELQEVEIQFAVVHNDDLSIENAARRQGRPQWFQQLREVTVQQLFIAALDEDFVSVTKYQRAK